MGAYEQWPYSNLHDLNLDWILQVVGDFKRDLDSVNAHFAEQIAALDAKTAEEIAAYNHAVEDANTQLNTDVQSMIDELRTARNGFYQDLSDYTALQEQTLSDYGLLVKQSIPLDYSSFENAALKTIGNGNPQEGVHTNINDPYFLSQTAVWCLYPGSYTYTNTPAGSLSAENYHITLINIHDNYTDQVPTATVGFHLQFFHAINYSDPSNTIIASRYVAVSSGPSYTYGTWHLW